MNAHNTTHASPATARTAKADRQPWWVMKYTSVGAAIARPSAPPMLGSAVGTDRERSGNHFCTACTAIGAVGPSAAPRAMRLRYRAGTLAASRTGRAVSDHRMARAIRIHVVRTRLETNPTITADTLNSR